MFSAFFGAADDETSADEAQQCDRLRERARVSVLREFVAERLQEEARAFFDDDVARGRQVTDAAIQFADALAARQIELAGYCDNVAVADAIVQLVREHEGAAVQARRRRFERAVERRCNDSQLSVARLSEVVDNVSDRVEHAWRDTIASMLSKYDTVVFLSRTHRQMPAQLYDRWVRERARVVGAVGSEMRSLDVAYSLFRPDTSCEDDDDDDDDSAAAVIEEDHAKYARHTLLPLVDAADKLAAASGGVEHVRIELTLNLSLLRGVQRRITSDDGVDATGVHCSMAYRCYAVAPQRRVEIDDQ